LPRLGTFASGEKIIYINGRLAARSQTVWMRAEVTNLKARLSLGGKTPWCFDELVVRDRVLTAGEHATTFTGVRELTGALNATEGVAQAAAVRYLHRPAPGPGSLYNAAGFPAAPFRFEP